MSKLEDKPLTKSLGPFLQEKWSKTARNYFSMQFGGIWAPPNGRKKVHKGLQVGQIYVSMSKLKNKPLTESLGPFL
jgi:hypothetical protein